MEKISVEWYGGGATPICKETACPFVQECANHETAGEFREEDGMTPKLHYVDGAIFCEKIQGKEFGIIKLVNGEFQLCY